MRLKFFLLLLFLLPLFILADVFFIEGKGRLKYTTWLTHNISFAKNKPTFIKITRFPSSENSLYLNQTITNYKIRFNTPPFKKREYIDQLSNHVLEAHFKPVLLRGRLNTISYEITFDAILDYLVYDLETSETCPIDPVNLSSYHSLFTKPSYGIPVNRAIYKKARSIVRKQRVIPIVIQLLNQWINDTITESPLEKAELLDFLNGGDSLKFTRFHAAMVLKNQNGNYLGKLNLLSSFLRSLGIPVRLVGGHMIPNCLTINPAEQKANADPETQDMPILSCTPKQYHYWLEAYIPHYGWLAVDPRYSSLMLFPRYLKKRMGRDLIEVQEYNAHGRKILEDFFYEENIENKPAYTIMGKLSTRDSMYFSAPVNYLDTAIAFAALKSSPAAPPEPKTNALYVKTSSLFSKCIEDAKMTANPIKPTYAQAITIDKEKTIDYLRLSLFTLDNNGGKMYVRIFQDTNGNVGSLQATSDRVPIANMNISLARFKYYKFTFNYEKKKSGPQALVLKPGKYWIIPLIKGSTSVHWALQKTAAFGELGDSFLLSGSLEKAKMLDGDFSFGIHFKEDTP